MPKLNRLDLTNYPFIPMPEKFLGGTPCAVRGITPSQLLLAHRDEYIRVGSYVSNYSVTDACHLRVTNVRHRYSGSGRTRPGLHVVVYRCKNHALEESEPGFIKNWPTEDGPTSYVHRFWGPITFEWRVKPVNPTVPGKWGLLPIEFGHGTLAVAKHVPTENEKSPACEHCGRGAQEAPEPEWSELLSLQQRHLDKTQAAVVAGTRKARRASDIEVLFSLFPEAMTKKFYGRIITAEKNLHKVRRAADRAREKGHIATLDRRTVNHLAGLDNEFGRLRGE